MTKDRISVMTGELSFDNNQITIKNEDKCHVCLVKDLISIKRIYLKPIQKRGAMYVPKVTNCRNTLLYRNRRRMLNE